MKTGTKSTDILLRVMIGVCVLYTLMHLGEFLYSRIPPYHAGQCLNTPNPMLTLKVDKNHVIQGYSDVELKILGTTQQKGPVSFDDLRDPLLEPTECQGE